jgi:hypothetical protein
MLGGAKPSSIASHVLHLPGRGAQAVKRRAWRTEWNKDQPAELARMVLLDERRVLRGVGVPREERQWSGQITL